MFTSIDRNELITISRFLVHARLKPKISRRRVLAMFREGWLPKPVYKKRIAYITYWQGLLIVKMVRTWHRYRYRPEKIRLANLRKSRTLITRSWGKGEENGGNAQ